MGILDMLNQPQIPFARDEGPPVLPVPEDQDDSFMGRMGGVGGLLTAIGGTLQATGGGWFGQPYRGEVQQMLDMRQQRKDRQAFRQYAKEMADYVPEGTREQDLWTAVASGNRQMSALLPSLWSAQSMDEKARAAKRPKQMSLANIRSNANIDSFRSRYKRTGVGLIENLGDTLKNKDSELRQAMEHKYGETPEEYMETERFRRWVLYNSSLQRAGDPSVPYDDFVMTPDGQIRIISQGPGQGGAEPGAEPSSPEPSLWDQALDFGRGLLDDFSEDPLSEMPSGDASLADAVRQAEARAAVPPVMMTTAPGTMGQDLGIINSMMGGAGPASGSDLRARMDEKAPDQNPGMTPAQRQLQDLQAADRRLRAAGSAVRSGASTAWDFLRSNEADRYAPSPYGR